MLQEWGSEGKRKQGKINQKVKVSQRTTEQPQQGLQLQSKREQEEPAREIIWEKIKDCLKQLKQH